MPIRHSIDHVAIEPDQIRNPKHEIRNKFE